MRAAGEVGPRRRSWHMVGSQQSYWRKGLDWRDKLIEMVVGPCVLGWDQDRDVSRVFFMENELVFGVDVRRGWWDLSWATAEAVGTEWPV